MPAFAFSLQRVLDYRRLEEGWAQEAHRAAREARQGVEDEIAAIAERRRAADESGAETLAARLDLETYLGALGGEEAAVRERLVLREREEAQAAETWRERRVAAEALQKLREKALEEWRQEEARREQAELDEWTVTRR